MTNSLKKHHNKYEKKRSSKRVSFNIETEFDLFQYANTINFSNEVKTWLTKKMEEKAEMEMIDIAINKIQIELNLCEEKAKNDPSQYKDGLIDGLNRALRSLEVLKNVGKEKRG